MSQIPALVGGNALSHGISMFVDHGGASGTKMHVGGQAKAATTASATLTNTTDETGFNSFTIPADTLVAGSTIRVSGAGKVPSTNSTDTLTIALRLGPSATALGSRESVFSSAAVDVANNDIWFVDGVIQVRTAGASGTAVGMFSYQDPDAAGTAPKKVLKASFTLNTTVETKLTMTGDWSVGSTDNQCNSEMFVVDIVNPNT